MRVFGTQRGNDTAGSTAGGAELVGFRGADVRYEDNEGNSALSLAASAGLLHLWVWPSFVETAVITGTGLVCSSLGDTTRKGEGCGEIDAGLLQLRT